MPEDAATRFFPQAELEHRRGRIVALTGGIVMVILLSKG
jgi:hypothetical protein